jgi:hypothetical protein
MILGTFLGENATTGVFLCVLADNVYSIFYVSVLTVINSCYKPSIKHEKE